MNKLRSMEYIDKDHTEEILNIENNRLSSALSPFSLEIINAVFTHQITVILSQGSLNITPLVACLYAYNQNHDVLIGIPKARFDEVYKGYTRTYFSLTYRKAVNNILSNPFFFYTDMFWCKGRIDASNNVLTNIDIETNPTYGRRDFKERYNSLMKQKLVNGLTNQNPILLNIPIETSLPSNIIGESKITFLMTEYKSLNYDPHLIIFESINERQFEFEHLLGISENIRISGKKLLLHFSWPYLHGLNSFIGKLRETYQDNIAVFHFGKRLCFELKETLNKPPESLLHLSLEGNQWDSVYYPDESTLPSIEVYLPYVEQISKDCDTVSIADMTWPFDEVLRDIWRMNITEDAFSNVVKNILKFPPVIDAFLHPSELKVKSYIEAIHSWRYIPIKEYLLDQTSIDENHVLPVYGIFSDLDSCKDFSRYLRGLHTNASPSKKTLFQMLLFEYLQNSINQLVNTSNDSDLQSSLTKFIIARTHPYFETRRGIFDSIQYFFSGISTILSHDALPRAVRKGKKIYVKIHTKEFEVFNGKKLIVDGFSFEQVLTQYLRLPLEVSQNVRGESLTLLVSVKLCERYIKLGRTSRGMEAKKQFLDRLYIYRLDVEPDGNFSEFILSNIAVKSNIYSNKFEVSLDVSVNGPGCTKQATVAMQFSHQDLSSLSRLNKDMIQQSILLVPGPVPFQTITDSGIIITKGYASLLLPFKKTILFSYPGINFKRISRQIWVLEQLYKEELTDVSIRDLSYSLQQTHKCHIIELPTLREQSDGSLDQLINGDTPFDAAVREELTNECTARDDDEKQEISTLKDIWQKLKADSAQKVLPSPQSRPFYSNCDLLPIRVRFENGTVEQIAFSRGTLIRRKINGKYLLCPIEDLNIGDEILCVETSDKLSIDNYVLKDYFDDQDLSMEQILEPFTCLKLFYHALHSINLQQSCSISELRNLYWLPDKDKEILIRTISSSLNQYVEDNQENNFESNNFWYPVISMDELKKVFGKNGNRITYSKTFRIAKRLGISIAENTFNQYCSLALNEENHYFFKNSKDLLALGRLMKHTEICNDYETINDMGRKVGRILQIIGQSISRVTSGNSELLNELDIGIEKVIKKCMIIDKIDS